MVRRCFRCVLLGLTTALGVARPAMAADEELSRIALAGEVPRTARRLAAADELAAREQWTEAVDEYHRILTEAGDHLVPVDGRHCLEARRLCHLRLAALPPAALRLYRNRVDSQAKKWLDQGTATRDTALLRRLVEEAFCSRHTDQALELLGDLAFERGGFEEAERWWRMLALPASERGRVSAGEGGRAKEPNAPALPFAHSPTLLFPDPQVDLARVRAKQILARLFRGECAGVQEELRAFRTLHATARGRLAGQEGVYAEILGTLAGQQETLVAPATERAWATFGGNPSRSLIVPKPPGRWAQLRPLDGPQWTVSLDPEGSAQRGGNDAESSGKVSPPFKAARSLAFHPVIDGDRVFVADARYVTGYRLLDGRRILRYDLADHVKEDLHLKLGLPAEQDLSYTLTVAGDRLYARLGAQALGPPRKDGARDTHHTYLVCLNLQLDVNGKLERWNVASQGTAATGPVFEGAPVVGHGRVFIAESRFAGGQTRTAIACYDAGTGKLRWQQDVCSDTQEFKLDEGKQRYRHHLVTLAGSTLFYCSHSGAIVALDALTGRRLWGVRYPGQAQQTVFGETPPRDLSPCVYAGGRLYVAPLDFDRILCLDPDTGRRLWENGPLQVIQLLGVAKGQLIVTATTPGSCIRALDAATGRDLRRWMRPDDGSELKTFGRGVLAGDWVFWPVRDSKQEGVYVLNQEDGECVLFDKAINGNLAVGNGCLAVAGTRELAVYAPEGRLLQRRREEAAQPNVSALARYRLGLAEAGAGLYSQALADLEHVETRAGPGERSNGTALRDLVRARRHEVLLDAAEQAQRAQQWEEAARFLTQAAGEGFPRFACLAALARQAALWTRAAQPARAVAVWQSILEDAALGHGPIVDADGTPHAAAGFAGDRITELIQAHGPAVYAAVEQRARALLAGARGARRKEALDRLARQFPNAAATGPALLELGQVHEQDGQFGAAARAYRLFLRRDGADAERPLALAGLARAYERQNCWSAARAAWQQLSAEQGERTVAAIDRDRPVRAFVTQRLQKAEYQCARPSHRPELPLPLARAWQSASVTGESENGEWFLPPAGDARCGAGSGYLFSVRGRTLTCREGLTGRPCWKSTLPQTPAWIGCHADAVLVAGADSVHGLSRGDGTALWSLSLATDDRPRQLSAFRLAGPRLFFLQEERRLFALDVFSGRVLWSSWAPAGRFELPYPRGRFGPSYHAGEESLVLQTGAGNWLVLDSRTGRRLGESAKAGQPWPRPPLALDERHLCLVNGPGDLLLLDSRTGKEVWTCSIARPVSLTGEAPQVLGNREALLVLVPRNYGYYLECLDPRTGSRRWPKPRYLGTEPIDLEGGTLDDTAVYLVQNNTLLAQALGDGQPLWQRGLPVAAGHWHTLRTGSHLVTFPRDADVVQWQLRWVFLAVQLRLVLPRAVQPGRYFAVLLCDPRTGRPLQRFHFPAGRPRARVQVGFTPEPVVLPELRSRRLPVHEPAAAVQVSERGITVVLDGKAWGLTAASGNGG